MSEATASSGADWTGLEGMSVLEADLVAKGMDPFMTPEQEAQYEARHRIEDATKEAVTLAKEARREEGKVDLLRVEAGLRFIELRAMVQATGASWEQWYVQNVKDVSICTAQRYMALARPSLGVV